MKIGNEIVMDSNELKARTKKFAHRCVKLSISLPKTTLGRHIKLQLIRCATSVAANYRATVLAQSSASFTSKLSIVLEEIDEATFWLEFIDEEKLLTPAQIGALLKESNELTAIFFAARKTLKQKA